LFSFLYKNREQKFPYKKKGLYTPVFCCNFLILVKEEKAAKEKLLDLFLFLYKYLSKKISQLNIRALRKKRQPTTVSKL
jgi:hypothetical protein